MATITGTFNSLVSGTLSGVIGTPGPQGIPGAQGPQGPAGAAGAPGVGVPAGGSTGQYLVKTSGLDFATGWQTLSLSGYLSLDGGSMNANAEIYFEDAVQGRVALASGSAFAVSSSSNPDLVSNLLYDRVFVKNATSQTTLKPTGVEFPDLTLQTTAFPGFSGYLTISAAASTYQTLAGMSSYLTTATAASTYYLQTNPAGYITSSALSGYAPLASPAFSGVPTAPSAALGTDSDQIATTAFVQDSIIAGSAHAETLQASVRNETGSTLAAFTVVYITGASGNKATVSKAQANSETTSSGTFAILETAIPNNQNGVAIVAGVLSGQNTLAFAEGAQLWLSPSVAGGVTSTKPSAPDNAVFIGVVTRVHANQGTVEVRIQNGYELQELHNVSITSVANGDLLAYDSATTLWKNKSASTLGLETSAHAASTYYLQTNPDGFIGDAPSDGSQYARQDGAWEVVSGGGGGIPDAPLDNYLYGRINGMWYRVPGFTPFSQIATHFSSVAGWAVYGGNVYLSPSGVVSVDTASTVTGIAIYLGDTSTSTIDLSPLSGMTGQISLNTLTSMTATPTLPSGGFNNLYINNCAFNALPALDSYTSLTVLTVSSCPNLTSIPNVSSYFSGQIDINSCPITSIPSIGLATYVAFQNTAITSGPYLGSNDSLNSGTVSGNALMVTAPSFYGANVLGTAYVNSNVSMTGAPSFYYCAMMSTVEVSNNAVMASFPDFTGCSNLGYVNISNNASMSASPSIPFSANLYHVNLSNNPLMSSTPSLGGFPNLTHINLSGCNIDASSLDGFGSSIYSTVSAYGIYGGYMNISGGTNGAFDSTSLPSWIGDLQSYYSWTIVYNSY